MNIPERLSKWVEDWLSTTKQLSSGASIVPLAGDGSTRSFFRLKLPDKSYVLLSDAEWILSRDYASHQEYLAAHQIPVPKFLAVDQKAGLGIMEDLGDELLQDRLRRMGTDPASKTHWLSASLILLASLHGRTYPVPATLPCATRRFDTQKYFDELGFTFEHLQQKFLGLPAPSKDDLSVVRAFCRTLDGIHPDVFSHRDYHTRNLLVVGEKLYMIDFQDARLGPVQYDLASLLYDAYVPISEDEKAQLLEIYRNELARYPLYQVIDWESFAVDLKRVAFQRVVKAAGSFASFYTRYGKMTHLPYLLPALESAARLSHELFSAGAPETKALDVEGWIKKVKEKGEVG